MKQKVLSRRAASNRADAAAANGKRRSRRRTGRQTLNYILILLAASAVMGILSLTVFFRIEKLEVTGSSRYAQQEILAASGVKKGDNLFRVSEKNVNKKLTEKYPYIEMVQLKRTFPPKLTLVVKQAEPLGAASSQGGYVVIGQNGRILESGVAEPPEGMTIVTGMYLSDTAAGRTLGQISPKGTIITPEEMLAAQEEKKSSSSSKPAYPVQSSSTVEVDPKTLDRQRRERAAQAEEDCFDMLALLVQAVEETEFERITLVDFTDRLNMMLVYDDRLLIELGSQANLPYKLKFARRVIEEDLEPTFEGIMDLSIDKEVWTKPANIEQELEKRRIIAKQAATGESTPDPDENNPEQAVIPGSAPVKKEETEDSSSSEVSSSRNELAVIPNEDKESSEPSETDAETSTQV